MNCLKYLCLIANIITLITNISSQSPCPRPAKLSSNASKQEITDNKRKWDEYVACTKAHTEAKRADAAKKREEKKNGAPKGGSPEKVKNNKNDVTPSQQNTWDKSSDAQPNTNTSSENTVISGQTPDKYEQNRQDARVAREQRAAERKAKREQHLIDRQRERETRTSRRTTSTRASRASSSEPPSGSDPAKKGGGG